jgi:glutamate dehydrogenase/leucine dehydrogenase
MTLVETLGNDHRSMRIAILGVGNVGSALARRLAARGHDVTVAFSRDRAKLEGWLGLSAPVQQTHRTRQRRRRSSYWPRRGL